MDKLKKLFKKVCICVLVLSTVFCLASCNNTPDYKMTGSWKAVEMTNKKTEEVVRDGKKQLFSDTWQDILAQDGYFNLTIKDNGVASGEHGFGLSYMYMQIGVTTQTVTSWEKTEKNQGICYTVDTKDKQHRYKMTMRDEDTLVLEEIDKVLGHEVYFTNTYVFERV